MDYRRQTQWNIQPTIKKNIICNQLHTVATNRRQPHTYRNATSCHTVATNRYNRNGTTANNRRQPHTSATTNSHQISPDAFTGLSSYTRGHRIHHEGGCTTPHKMYGTDNPPHTAIHQTSGSPISGPSSIKSNTSFTQCLSPPMPACLNIRVTNTRTSCRYIS